MPDADDPGRRRDHPYGGFSSDVIELLRAADSSTPLHQLLGLQFVIGDDPAVVMVEMPVAPGAFNGSGNLHGGAIASLVDVAAGFGRGARRDVPARREHAGDGRSARPLPRPAQGHASCGPRPGSCGPGAS